MMMDDEKQRKIKQWILRALFIIFVVMLANNFHNFKQEYEANQDIFTFYMTNTDNILDNNKRINLSIEDYKKEHKDNLMLYGTIAENNELDQDRCYLMYPLLQRWYTKYLSPLFCFLGLILIVRVIFIYLDFNKIKEFGGDLK